MEVRLRIAFERRAGDQEGIKSVEVFPAQPLIIRKIIGEENFDRRLEVWPCGRAPCPCRVCP